MLGRERQRVLPEPLKPGVQAKRLLLLVVATSPPTQYKWVAQPRTMMRLRMECSNGVSGSLPDVLAAPSASPPPC